VSQLLVAQRALTVPGWAKDALWRRAQAIPSLDLRFADNKSLVDAVTGASLVTFTRASSGTFVGSNGVLQTAVTDVPRFDHNPTTGESLGLLVEEARTNLVLRSEEFDNASWSKGAASISANSIAAPNGTVTADTLIEDATTAEHLTEQSFLTVSGTSYTFSVYVKSDGVKDKVGLRFTTANWSGSSSNIVRFDLATGVGTTVSGSPIFSSQALPNGWWKFSITSTSSSTGSATARIHLVATGGTNLSYAGDGTSGMYLWGAQLEAGAFPTSYIPTTTATVTRSADVASDTTRGGNIRSLYVQFRSPASGTRPVVSLDDNTANERIEILTSGSDPNLLVTDGGSAVADLDAGAVSANTTARIAARFNTDNFAASISGGAEALDATGTMPMVDRIRVGSNQAGGYLNGTIARITGWDAPLVLLPTITQ
jgi:hypothetical protein